MSEGGTVLEDTDHAVEGRSLGELLGQCLMEGREVVVDNAIMSFLILLGECVAFPGLHIPCILLPCESVRKMCLSYFLSSQYAN